MTERQRLLRLQAVYYCATGLTPIASMRFFESITGNKCDRWLVRMVGLLAASIGLSLGLSSLAEDEAPAALALSCTSALAFAGIDITYAAKRQISLIYLGDAVVELILVGLIVRSSLGNNS